MGFNLTIANTPYATPTEYVNFLCQGSFIAGDSYDVFDSTSGVLYGSTTPSTNVVGSINIIATTYLTAGSYTVILKNNVVNYLLTFSFVIFSISLANQNFVSINDTISFNCVGYFSIGMYSVRSLAGTLIGTAMVMTPGSTLTITGSSSLVNQNISPGNNTFILQNQNNTQVTATGVTVYARDFILDPSTRHTYLTYNITDTFKFLTHSGLPMSGTYQVQIIDSNSTIYSIGSSFSLAAQSYYNFIGSVPYYGVFTLQLIDQSNSTNVLNDFEIRIDDPIIVNASLVGSSINVSTNDAISIQFNLDSGIFSFSNYYSILDGSGNPYPSANTTYGTGTSNLLVQNLHFSEAPSVHTLYLKDQTNTIICIFIVTICTSP